MSDMSDTWLRTLSIQLSAISGQLKTVELWVKVISTQLIVIAFLLGMILARLG